MSLLMDALKKAEERKQDGNSAAVQLPEQNNMLAMPPHDDAKVTQHYMPPANTPTPYRMVVDDEEVEAATAVTQRYVAPTNTSDTTPYTLVDDDKAEQTVEARNLPATEPNTSTELSLAVDDAPVVSRSESSNSTPTKQFDTSGLSLVDDDADTPTPPPTTTSLPPSTTKPNTNDLLPATDEFVANWDEEIDFELETPANTDEVNKNTSVNVTASHTPVLNSNLNLVNETTTSSQSTTFPPIEDDFEPQQAAAQLFAAKQKKSNSANKWGLYLLLVLLIGGGVGGYFWAESWLADNANSGIKFKRHSAEPLQPPVNKLPATPIEAMHIEEIEAKTVKAESETATADNAQNNDVKKVDDESIALATTAVESTNASIATPAQPVVTKKNAIETTISHSKSPLETGSMFNFVRSLFNPFNRESAVTPTNTDTPTTASQSLTISSAPTNHIPRLPSETGLMNVPDSRTTTHSANLHHYSPQQLRQHNLTRSNQALVKAYQAFQRGDNDTAQRAYQQVLKVYPNNRDALLGIAALRLKQGDNVAAQRTYQQVLRLHPQDRWAKAGLLSSQQDALTPRNEMELKNLLVDTPQSPDVYFSLGNVYAQQQRWEAAYQAYAQAYHYASGQADYAYNLAISAEHIRRPQQALYFYQRAATLVQQGQPYQFDFSTVQQRIQTLQQTYSATAPIS